MPKKKEDEFNNLKNEYIQLCKEANKLQIELKKIDNKREDIIKDIRSLQKNKLNSLDYNLLLNINNDNEDISDQVNKNISNSMIISNSSNKVYVAGENLLNYYVKILSIFSIDPCLNLR